MLEVSAGPGLDVGPQAVRIYGNVAFPIDEQDAAFDGSACSEYVISATARGRRRSERYTTRAAGRVAAARWPSSFVVSRGVLGCPVFSVVRRLVFSL